MHFLKSAFFFGELYVVKVTGRVSDVGVKAPAGGVGRRFGRRSRLPWGCPGRRLQGMCR